MYFDMVIENGWIVDGISNEVWPGKVGVSNGRIQCIEGKNTRMRAERFVDAGGMIVAPGFIDVHSHADHYLLHDPVMKHKLLQGVTTEIGGNCGFSAFPMSASGPFCHESMEREVGWRSFDEFLTALNSRGLALNYGSLIGHNCLRERAGAERADPAGPAQLKSMKRAVAKAMDEGAFGLSSGMNLLPASMETTRELADLTRVVARKGGVFSVHLRNESDDILNALSEAVLIGVKGKVQVEVSHFKVLDRTNWACQEDALNLIRKMRSVGIDMNPDFFPYSYVCAPLRIIFPGWITAGGTKGLARALSSRRHKQRLEQHLADIFPDKGSYATITLPGDPGKKTRHGENLYKVARSHKTSPLSVLIETANQQGLDRYVYYECVSESNVKEVAKFEGSVVASDSFPTERPSFFKHSIIHPRTFGTFPQFLSDFVYRKHLLKLPEAIKKMTSLPAARYGIKDRGCLAKGAFADITIFDPENLESDADANDPCRYPKGVERVIVNGELVIEKGQYTGASPGRALRRNE